jgi:hypothetical protein
MDRTGSFCLGMALGIIGLYSAMHYVVVRAEDGYHVLSKIAPKLELPYEDIRGFKLTQWQKKQSLALAVVKARKSHLFRDPSLVSFKEQTKSVLDRFQGSSGNGS